MATKKEVHLYIVEEERQHRGITTWQFERLVACTEAQSKLIAPRHLSVRVTRVVPEEP